MSMRDRPTADLIVLALTATISLVILATLTGVAIAEIIQPQTDSSRTLRYVFDVTASLVTGVVGYLGGKAVGRNENGGSAG